MNFERMGKFIVNLIRFAAGVTIVAVVATAAAIYFAFFH